MEIIAQREFNIAYICLDSIFIVIFCMMLFFSKRKLTLIYGLFGGILYFVVDFGIFHLATHSRRITGGSLFWVLLWMSLSYGITNFAWIWLALKKDQHFAEWTILILSWWLACPMLSKMFTHSPQIIISRTTSAYHGTMGIFLFISYFAIVVYNLWQKDKNLQVNILWLFTIGVAVQFGWEFSLLIGGIRSSVFNDIFYKLSVLTVNSLVETNLGLPAMYVIYLFVSTKFTENLKKVENKSFKECLRENNFLKYKTKSNSENVCSEQKV